MKRLINKPAGQMLMTSSISHLCRRCRGECCEGLVFLTKGEYEKLKLLNKRLRVKTEGACFLISNRICPFLDKKTGCILAEKDRPLDCIIFPLSFTYRAKKLSFYLNKYCDHIHKIPKGWALKNMRQVKSRLKQWSSAEKKSYHAFIMRYSSKMLKKF
jgi:Fe-S-cluster containining protein